MVSSKHFSKRTVVQFERYDHAWVDPGEGPFEVVVLSAPKQSECLSPASWRYEVMNLRRNRYGERGQRWHFFPDEVRASAADARRNPLTM